MLRPTFASQRLIVISTYSDTFALLSMVFAISRLQLCLKIHCSMVPWLDLMIQAILTTRSDNKKLMLGRITWGFPGYWTTHSTGGGV